MKIITTLVLLVMSSLLCAKVQKSQGKAYNKKGEVVYIENHTYTFEENPTKLEVTYITPKDSKPYAKLNVDFSKSAYIPDSTFENFSDSTKAVTKFTPANKEVKVTYKSGNDEKEKSDIIKYKKNLLSIHGLNQFIRDNFNDLVNNEETKEFRLIVPARLDSYSFKAKVIESSDSEVVFEIEIDSWFLGMFAPSLKLTYDISERRLKLFQGASNMIPAKSDSEEVKVEFTYF